MRLRRQQKGYGMLGVSWAFSEFGRTLIVCFGRWELSGHWRNREMELLLAQVAEQERQA